MILLWCLVRIEIESALVSARMGRVDLVFPWTLGLFFLFPLAAEGGILPKTVSLLLFIGRTILIIYFCAQCQIPHFNLLLIDFSPADKVTGPVQILYSLAWHQLRKV